METYKRLNSIKKIISNFNSFYIQSLDKLEGEIIGHKIVVFKPFFYKKILKIKNWEITSSESNIVEIDIMNACRKILVLIRDNHEVDIEKIYNQCQNISRMNIRIKWTFPLDNLETIKYNIKKYNRTRREEKNWDSDTHIWPQFQKLAGRTYVIKDVITGIINDDINFLEKVHNDGFYNDFLFSIKWNPITLLGDQSLFSNVPRDDFGEYDPSDNAIIHCTKNSALFCLRYLLFNNASPDYQNSDKMTALHIAVIKNNFEAVKLLLEYKANTNKLDYYGLVAEKYAYKLGFLEIINLFRMYKN